MKPRSVSFLAVATGLVVVLSACGAAATPSPAASVAASVAASTAAGGPISVELKEWAVTPESVTAKAGAITFNVKNAGTKVHEFVVVKTDLKAEALPVSGSKIDESALTPVDEIEDIAVGATPTLTVTLAAGHYVLLCNIETHFGLGMRSDFDVN